jgi:RNA methyltransferase, TrmH family
MASTITSMKDSHVAQLRVLSTRAGRMAEGRCVIEGELLVDQTLSSGAEIEFALREEGSAAAVAGRLTAAGVPVLDATGAVLRKALRTQRPVTMLAVARVAGENDDSRPYCDFAVVLDGVADPGNLGTIVRTACGLGAFDVVCTDNETDLTSRKVRDASRASVLRAAVRRFPTVAEALEALRANGFQIVTTSQRGRSVQALAPLSWQPVALVVGNETDGVSDDALAHSDVVVQIPMTDETESLNVGVATGLSISELRLRMVLAGIADRAQSTLDTQLGTALNNLRAAQAEQLATVDHLDVAELAVLTSHLAAPDAAVEPWDLDDEALGRARDMLVAKGFLASSADAVTDAGRHALAALWHVHQRAEAELLANLNPAEREQLTSLLSKLSRARG